MDASLTPGLGSVDLGRRGPEVLRYAAFTDAGAGGNPAGVVLDAESLGDEEMLAIAAAVGYSETAFLQGRMDDGDRRLRFFSPLAEVAFCGHATIATAVALAERDGPGQVGLSTPAGHVEVHTTATTEGLTATLTSPPTHTRPADPGVLDRALTALRWRYDDLDPRYPAHVAFAGNEHLVVAARTLERLAAFDYDFDALERVMAEQRWTTVHAVWAEGGAVFHARDAFPPGGVVEDPATGAAAAAFGGYLRDLRLTDVPGRVTILQGRHMGRPSRLLVDLSATSDSVRVTGAATRLGATGRAPA